MKDFPKWMLALAGVNLLPVLASPFYLWYCSSSVWMPIDAVIHGEASLKPLSEC